MVPRECVPYSSGGCIPRIICVSTCQPIPQTAGAVSPTCRREILEALDTHLRQRRRTIPSGTFPIRPLDHSLRSRASPYAAPVMGGGAVGAVEFYPRGHILEGQPMDRSRAPSPMPGGVALPGGGPGLPQPGIPNCRWRVA